MPVWVCIFLVRRDDNHLFMGILIVGHYNRECRIQARGNRESNSPKLLFSFLFFLFFFFSRNVPEELILQHCPGETQTTTNKKQLKLQETTLSQSFVTLAELSSLYQQIIWAGQGDCCNFLNIHYMKKHAELWLTWYQKESPWLSFFLNYYITYTPINSCSESPG